MAKDLNEKSQRPWILRTGIVALVFLALLVAIVAARPLILPCLVAAILAYLCKPIVYLLRRKNFPNELAVLSVAGTLLVVVGVSLKLATGALPEGLDRSEAQVKAEFRLNHSAEKILRISTENPHWAYKQFKPEIDYLMTQLNDRIRISNSEKKILLEQRPDLKEKVAFNLTRPQWQPAPKENDSEVVEDKVKAHINFVVNSLALWILLPIVLVFLLGDDGSIFRFVMGFVPNRYFELSLTMLERTDRAIGHYLRGTALECTLVGLVIGVGLIVFGVDLKAAILIGLISGVTNAIPFLGTVVGLGLGMAYGLINEEIHPLLPFLGPDDLLWGVLATVGLAHVLDNAIFQPVLVGKAVNLHPLAIVLGVAAGGVGFGVVGVLLAIPALVIIKTGLETLFSGLRDYRLI